MRIIDFERKGNVVRFYLGKETLDYGWINPAAIKEGEQAVHKTPWGDDWDDRPYDCNAGMVYDEYIHGYADIAFPFDTLVLEPSQCGFYGTCDVSKEDMQKRKVPCIIAVSPSASGIKTIFDYASTTNFFNWCGSDSTGVKKYYFGDEMEPTHIGTDI